VRFLICSLLAAVVGISTPLFAQGAAQTVTLIANAPVFVTPNESQTPLRVGKEGSALRLLQVEGDWYRVEFDDPQFGHRVGYVSKQYARLAAFDAQSQPGLDLSLRESPARAPGQQVRGGGAQGPTHSTSEGQSPALQEFRNAKLQIQQGDKQKEIDSVLRYEPQALVVRPNGQKEFEAARTLRYSDVTSAEYTFGKSPRIAAALLVSPLFLFNSSKSHWLTIKTGDDYALLRLDKSNYKLVIAELEKRTHVVVASIGENK